MEVTTKYKPLSSMILIFNELDDSLSQGVRDKYVTTEYLDNTEELANVCVTFLRKGGKKYVLGARCENIKDSGANWSMWLSSYFPDEFLSAIHESLGQWDTDWETEEHNSKAVTTSYQVVMTIANEKLVMEESQ